MKLPYLALVALFLAYPASGQEKPNILLFFVDDMGATDLGCYGSDLYRTPNIDKLAAQGVLYKQAYASAHICSPTRAAMVTGKYPARIGLTDFMTGHKRPYAKLKVPAWTMGLPAEEFTLGHLLKEQGYSTAWLGKWHLGGSARDFGFDAGNQLWIENTKNDPKDPKGVYTLNKEAVDFIENTTDKPFFVALSHYSPHGPVRFDPDLRDEYQRIIDGKKPRQTNAGYAAMIEALDDSVGKMMDWLDGKKLAENTLVIFVSDNGGEMNYTSNAPLRAGKGTLYEGGIRVPMIARWPGKIEPGTTNDTRFTSMDFLPTFATLIGGKAPGKIDGADLSANFTSNGFIDRGPLYWHYPHYHNEKPSASILKEDWKLIEWFETGDTELFNLAVDPSEITDLSQSNPEKNAELLADLKAWQKEIGAQMMEPNPDHDPAKANEGLPKKGKTRNN
jgi:arylsulfatase A